MNKPQYKINGLERRALKKELSELRHFVKEFWRFHNLEKDMARIYNSEHSVMADDSANILYESKKRQVQRLEDILDEPYV